MATPPSTESVFRASSRITMPGYVLDQESLQQIDGISKDLEAGLKQDVPTNFAALLQLLEAMFFRTTLWMNFSLVWPPKRIVSKTSLCDIPAERE